MAGFGEVKDASDSIGLKPGISYDNGPTDWAGYVSNARLVSLNGDLRRGVHCRRAVGNRQTIMWWIVPLFLLSVAVGLGFGWTQDVIDRRRQHIRDRAAQKEARQ